MLTEVSAENLIRLSAGLLTETEIFIFEGAPQISEVHGVAVTAFVRRDGFQGGYFHVYFKLDDISYCVSLAHDFEYSRNLVTKIVNQLILGGPADLSVLSDPVIPELSHHRISLEEARFNPDFGIYVPHSAPDGFVC
jgi:hypothetical protein